MRLLRLQDVEIGSNDRVFRHSRLRALIVWLAGFAAATAFFFHAYTAKFRFGYFFGSFLLLFLLLTLKMVTARFHPSNWLVRMNDTGIYVQYRSYLNYQLPDDPSVMFLSLGEIASARLVKERVDTPDPMKPHATQTQYLHYVELELSGDTAPLAEALQTERGEQAPLEKHWYGSSSTLYQDYPVTLIPPTFVRIHWDVVPGAHNFLETPAPLHGDCRSRFHQAGLHALEIAQPRRSTEATPRTGRPRPDHHRHIRRPPTLRRQLRRRKADGGFVAGE